MAARAHAGHLTFVIVSGSSNAMKLRAWLLVCIGLATASQAQEIRKCVADGVVAYQNAPCSDGQAEAGVLKLPDYADPPQRDGATAPVPDSSTTAPVTDSSGTATNPATMITTKVDGVTFTGGGAEATSGPLTIPIGAIASATTAPVTDSSGTAASEAVPVPAARFSRAAFPFRTSIALRRQR